MFLGWIAGALFGMVPNCFISERFEIVPAFAGELLELLIPYMFGAVICNGTFWVYFVGKLFGTVPNTS